MATINGTRENDRLLGTHDDDTISGFAGNDSLNGELGDDRLYGGDGDDWLFGSYGDDFMKGDAGADVFVAGATYGRDTINWIELGKDRIWLETYVANSVADLYREATITSGRESNGVRFVKIEWPELGEDEDPSGWFEGDSLYIRNMTEDRLAEHLQIHSLGVTPPLEITGTAGNDTITGMSMGDTLIGGDGDDEIHGMGGDDWIDGERGNDTIIGGYGNDTVYGGPGDDRIWLSDLDFGDIDDTYNLAFGEAGNDIIRGGFRSDDIRGGSGDDWLMAIDLAADEAPDRLYGEVGNDTLEGSNLDYLDGGDGDDTIHVFDNTGINDPDRTIVLGGKGNDTITLNGIGAGPVRIDAYWGDDTLDLSNMDTLLDLRTWDDGLITGFENLSLEGDGASEVTLTADDVRAMSARDPDFLRLRGETGDTFHLVGAWQDRGIVDGFHVYAKDGVQVLAEPDVNVDFVA